MKPLRSFIYLYERKPREYTPGIAGIWLRRPIVCAAVCLFTGDVFGLESGLSLAFWAWFTLAISVLTLLFMVCKKPQPWLGLAVVLALGGCMGANVMRPLPVPQNGSYYVEGVISEVVKCDDTRVTVDLSPYSADGATYPGTLRLTMYRTVLSDSLPDSSLPQNCEPGTTLGLFAETTVPENSGGKYAFRYADYLIHRGIHVTAQGQLITAQYTLPARPSLAALSFRARQSVLQSLDEMLGDRAPAAKAILLGDKGSLPQELYESYRAAGFSHLLAVSGLHISLAAAVLLLLLRPLPQKLRYILLLPAVGAYLAVTGCPVSALRAGVMSALTCLCMLAGRRYDGYSSLACACTVVLALFPGMATDASFTLSFGAVLCIYAYVPVAQRFFHVPIFHNGFAGRMERAANVLLSGVALTFAVTLGLLPLTSRYYGSLNLVGLVTAFPAGLCGMGLLVSGWLAVFTRGIPGVGSAFAALAGIFSAGTDKIAEFTSGHGYAIIHLRGIDSVWLPVYALGMLLLTRAKPIKRGVKSVIAVALALLTVVLLLPPEKSDTLSYVQLSVGQGDAAVLTDGRDAFLIDVGPENGGAADYVRMRGLDVKGILLTHLHSDHMGALPELLALTGLENIYVPPNALGGADEDMRVLTEKLTAEGLTLMELRAGDTLTPIDGAQLHVLHPSEESDLADTNDYSLVTLLTLGERRLLLAGDLTEAGEDFEYPPCEVVKVGHHGSGGSTSLDLLAGCNPSLALISCGKNNAYGHPSPALLSRLAYTDVQPLITAERGDITITVAPNGSMTARTDR